MVCELYPYKAVTGIIVIRRPAFSPSYAVICLFLSLLSPYSTIKNLYDYIGLI